MAENLDVLDVTPTDDDMAPVAAFHTGASTAFDHRDPAGVSWLRTRFST
jgi:2,5-diketo-D-gluconate reductase A